MHNVVPTMEVEMEMGMEMAYAQPYRMVYLQSSASSSLPRQ